MNIFITMIRTVSPTRVTGLQSVIHPGSQATSPRDIQAASLSYN